MGHSTLETASQQWECRGNRFSCLLWQGVPRCQLYPGLAAAVLIIVPHLLSLLWLDRIFFHLETLSVVESCFAIFLQSSHTLRSEGKLLFILNSGIFLKNSFKSQIWFSSWYWTIINKYIFMSLSFSKLYDFILSNRTNSISSGPNRQWVDTLLIFIAEVSFMYYFI